MLLTIDMPFEQLKTYSRTNPRPDDFDLYWEHAIEEMNAVDSEVDLF